MTLLAACANAVLEVVMGAMQYSSNNGVIQARLMLVVEVQ
jgi:hypothetical protein